MRNWGMVVDRDSPTACIGIFFDSNVLPVIVFRNRETLRQWLRDITAYEDKLSTIVPETPKWIWNLEEGFRTEPNKSS
jgi:hypothetical protein